MNQAQLDHIKLAAKGYGSHEGIETKNGWLRDLVAEVESLTVDLTESNRQVGLLLDAAGLDDEGFPEDAADSIAELRKSREQVDALKATIARCLEQLQPLALSNIWSPCGKVGQGTWPYERIEQLRAAAGLPPLSFEDQLAAKPDGTQEQAQ